MTTQTPNAPGIGPSNAADDHIDVRITDTTLRDGSHAVRHQFTEDDVRRVATALDAAGVQVIEVTHGDGLAGSSFNYGFSKVHDIKLIEVAAGAVTNARIAALVLPGLGRFVRSSRPGRRVPASYGWRRTPPRQTSASNTSKRPANSGSRQSGS